MLDKAVEGGPTAGIPLFLLLRRAIRSASFLRFDVRFVCIGVRSLFPTPPYLHVIRVRGLPDMMSALGEGGVIEKRLHEFYCVNQIQCGQGGGVKNSLRTSYLEALLAW